MPSSTTRKRKAETSDDDSDRKASKTQASPRSGQLHLPPPVWGHVLDYMTYQEVRSALLVCKVIAHEAVRCVHTLNILRDCELDVPSARRFSNVKHVNILCLIKENDESHRFRDQTIISYTTPITSVPFLQIFPRLSTIFIGGVINGEKELHDPHSCVGERHVVLFRSLISSFIGAYKARLISQKVSIANVLATDSIHSLKAMCDLEREEGYSGNECRWCRNVCKHIPLQDHEILNSYYPWCLTGKTREKILLSRKGGAEVVASLKYIQVVDEIQDRKDWHILSEDIDDDLKLHTKLFGLGLEESRDGDPQYLSSDALRRIDDVAESLQVRPCDIPKDFFYEKNVLRD